MSKKSPPLPPSTEIVKLDGTIIKADGTMTKTKFFDFLSISLDDYSDIAYTREEAMAVRRHLMHLSTGATAAVPMICGGEAICFCAEKCPFVKLTITKKELDPTAKSLIPVGRACLVEQNLLHEWTRLYIQEFEIEEKNFTEFQMARELAEIELLLWRINNNLSKVENAELIEESTVGIDRQGNILTRKEPSALMNIKNQLWNRKSKLHKLMVGDRQEKYKRDAALKKRPDDDPSISSAKLHGEIKRLLREAKTLDLKVKATEGKVLEVVDGHTTTLSPEDLINKE